MLQVILPVNLLGQCVLKVKQVFSLDHSASFICSPNEQKKHISDINKAGLSMSMTHISFDTSDNPQVSEE